MRGLECRQLTMLLCMQLELRRPAGHGCAPLVALTDTARRQCRFCAPHQQTTLWCQALQACLLSSLRSPIKPLHHLATTSVNGLPTLPSRKPPLSTGPGIQAGSMAALRMQEQGQEAGRLPQAIC